MKRPKTLPATHIFSLFEFRALKIMQIRSRGFHRLKKLVLETATLFRVSSIILLVA